MRVCVVMLCVMMLCVGCARDRIFPDGTIEHEYLDPAVVALLERVIDVAEQAYASKDTDGAQQEVNEVETLIGLLPPELQEPARDALEAGEARDWVTLVEALDALDQARQTRRLPEE